MPNPRADEGESAYVSRFMESAEARRDFPDEKQRAAVAYSKFREKTNADSGGEPCRACGAARVIDNAASVNDCPHCGDRMLGAPTPPVEDLNNLCRTCLHAIEPSHDGFGCHVPGCGCTATNVGVVGDIKRGLLNAGRDPKAIWQALSQDIRRYVCRHAGVDESYMHVEQYEAIPAEARTKLGPALTGYAENGNGLTKFCNVCSSRLGGKSPEGLDGFVRDGVMHVVGNIAGSALCGVKMENANSGDDAWKDESDYNGDGGCKSCGWGAPGTGHSSGYHKENCAILRKERKKFEHLQGSERRNAAPDFDAAIAAFEAHCKSCPTCQPVRHAAVGSPKADARNLCATGAQLLVADLENADDQTLRANLEKHRRELAQWRETLAMAEKAQDADGVARAKDVIAQTEEKIRAAEGSLKGLDNGADLHCRECGENLGKATELSKVAYCGTCGGETKNPAGSNENAGSGTPEPDTADKRQHAGAAAYGSERANNFFGQQVGPADAKDGLRVYSYERDAFGKIESFGPGGVSVIWDRGGKVTSSWSGIKLYTEQSVLAGD